MTKEEMVDAPIGTPVGPPPDDPAVELFVSGRVCLLGEHSDWAGGFRSVNPEVGKGRCLVVGTLEGLHACASKGDAPTLRMTSTDNAGGRRSIELPLDDPAALLKTAAEGGFWSHVAGTVHALVGDSSSRHAAAVAAAGHGLVIDNHRTTLPVKKGLSSSAAVCVLVARAFSSVYGLSCSSREEMEIAYRGERTTPSRCGRMDQGRGQCGRSVDGPRDECVTPSHLMLYRTRGDERPRTCAS